MQISIYKLYVYTNAGFGFVIRRYSNNLIVLPPLVDRLTRVLPFFSPPPPQILGHARG